MQRAIEARELITVDVAGTRLRGTYHLVRDHGSHSRPVLEEIPRTGILFLNSGFVPRASGGDAAVEWADAFAKCGYPSFRFDLPGLGDSAGELPEKLLDFAALVNTGHYAAFVSGITRSLTDRFSLSGLVLAGHCAGAVSAIYAAATSKDVKGLIALDPYFFREEPDRTGIRNEISVWATQNKLAGELSKLYRSLKKLRSLSKRRALPQNANLPLIGCWIRLAGRGLPMLILNAGEPRPNAGEFDYLGHLQGQPEAGSHVAIHFIEGTNHSFADEVGRAAVRKHAGQWLEEWFPLVEREKIAALSGTRKGAEYVDSVRGHHSIRASRQRTG